jgi:Protein of unknown function (DUF3237)
MSIEAGLAPEIPVATLKTELVYEAIVDIGPLEPLGASSLGERRFVGILGGTFQGPKLKGKVRAGGADRQLVGVDGVRRLDALYELETDDGAVITVRNRALLEDLPGGRRYARSFLQFSAPLGPHDWLNRRIFVGTVDGLAPKAQVLIRVYLLD